ncbi:hypothetical protein [Nostoc sp. 2RC]|uniref:hypothetical protein n=1 Tax=Nostoc sp. 2RC TaxID=2485484 RepID=UPI001625C770|nr:hypothetical protein [Nostoc sp. 2RC]MBC1239915.1 hypothetical protein [Nostoc sp. 2RC]
MMKGKLGDGLNAEKLLWVNGEELRDRTQIKIIVYGVTGFGGVVLGLMAFLGRKKYSPFFFGFVKALILILLSRLDVKHSEQVASTNKPPFNYFGWLVLFPEDIQSNLVDLWYRWVRERGRPYAFFQMCLYLIKMINIPAPSAFKRKRSSTPISLQRKS